MKLSLKKLDGSTYQVCKHPYRLQRAFDVGDGKKKWWIVQDLPSGDHKDLFYCSTLEIAKEELALHIETTDAMEGAQQ